MHCPRGKEITCSWEVPNVGRGKLCGLLDLDAARPEDQPALVAYQEVVFAALALGLGHSPQQAAVTAPLRTQGETPDGEAGPTAQCGPTGLSDHHPHDCSPWKVMTRACLN